MTFFVKCHINCLGRNAVLAICLVSSSASGLAANVIEFYNRDLDNFFITANPAEAAAVDGGAAGPGWSRTGGAFGDGGDASVCRFYGSLFPGPNSHFYTVIAQECEALKQLQASTPAAQKRWNFESLDFRSTEPKLGACENGLTPVYRAYNAGATRGVDSNHRITTSRSGIDQVIARGWKDEGVVMCAPASPTVTLSADAASVHTGGGTTLTWTSANSTSCAASGGWSGVLGTSGSRWVRLDADGSQDFTISCSGPNGSAVSTRSVTATNTPHFALVPNAFPDMTPIHAAQKGAAVRVAAIGDFNGDGKSDIVFLYNGASPAGAVVTTPCANRIVIMTYQANGSFKDETTALMRGDTDLGGCPNKIKVLDLNGDGRPDILIAINQEDGRSLAPPSLTTAQLAALVSTPDGHLVVRKFGSPNFYNSVGVGFDDTGAPFVTGMGYAPGQVPETFRATGVDFVQTPNTLPYVSPNTFEFYGDSSANRMSRFLLQDGAYPNTLSVEGYVRANDGTWNAVKALDAPYPVVGSIDLITWTSDIDRNVPVMKVDDYYVLAGGGFAIPMSAVAHTSPGAAPVGVMRLELPRIPNYSPGALVRQSDLSTNSKLIGVAIANGQVAGVPLVLDTTDLLDVAYYNYFEFKDVNGDGYEDLLVYRYRSIADADYAKPLVYLNRRDGSFRLVGLAQFPTPVLHPGDSTQSIVHDFDGDGIPDLVYYPYGAGIGDGPSYLFYKGVRLLD